MSAFLYSLFLESSINSGLEICVEPIGIGPVRGTCRLAARHGFQRHRTLERQFVAIGIDKELYVPVAGQFRPFVEVQRQFCRASLE